MLVIRFSICYDLFSIEIGEKPIEVQYDPLGTSSLKGLGLAPTFFSPFNGL
jgi:hypothetical protein